METPVYRYNLRLLEETLATAQTEANRYNYTLHYAVKANNNSTILETIAKRGFGADCVSGNEITAAINAGFAPLSIVFAGVGKTESEIELAISIGIACIHVESIEELQLINRISARLEKTATIALRLNPNLDAGTHQHITTGTSRNKFGLSNRELIQAVDTLPSLQWVKFIGFHFHIGSQILDLKKFVQLAHYANITVRHYAQLNISYLNLGGGLGIDYDNPSDSPIPNFAEYFLAFYRNLRISRNISIHFEPGRSLVGQCGDLLTKVLYVKQSDERKFAVVDAGMNNLIRPALYQAKHKIEVVDTRSLAVDLYDVVGPICESTDTFASNIELPALKQGDILAIHSAGAYGESMSSRYNLRDGTESIFVDEANLTLANP
ncbi:MAG: diaminopimelate decarboxylase [Bacteroidales bacterium]|nr:diaminopimelate decarboxylase [Bacteroidales bacterium]MBN2749444.1 diaminopimelate decarboxylase [Bacteroidales bacterium]